MHSLELRLGSDAVLPFTMLLFFAGLIFVPVVVGDDAISFNRDIRPLLSDRCFACHGPDEESREAGLRLDRADGSEGALNYAITPGSVEGSEFWERVTSDDKDLVMPPPSSHKPPLSKEELSVFRRWIESGADFETFWAFQKPIKTESPAVKHSDWSDHPIDLFVLHRLETMELSPSPPADPRTLIRRVTLDLTGLPPTREEVKSFVKAYRQDPQEAWEKVVDQLMSQPQFGEHMARYWLDLVRFADTNGMHKDFYRNNIQYRNWVIRSFNDNLGYDDFLRYQLAGDLFEDPTHDQLIASGFNRLHLIIDRGTALPEESFTKNVLDRVTAVGTAFMGLTVNCAQCHDHKYDPLTQKDFYSLYAFFNNIDAKPETVARPKFGLQPPFISLGTPEQEKRLQELNQQVQSLDAEIKTLKSELKKEAGDAANQESAPTETLKEMERRRKKLARDRDKVDAAIPRAMVMKERTEVRPTHVLIRGQYDDPGEEVLRNTPEFLPPMKTENETPTRMDLANWFVDPENPLTARTAVNRIWQQFFGVGIVKTSEDLGAQGEVPKHPELLDYLAVEFVESNWDVKALVKQIVMSKTYQQSSSSTPDQFKQDPENRWLARGSRFRMDAEMVRDQILATSGLMSGKMYGPSVKPPQPDGLWKAVTMIGERFEPDTGEAIYRRSLYTYWKRAMPPPQMTIMNAPIRDACIARRERTNTPSQALLLLNESEYLKAARQLAQQALEKSDGNPIDYMWETVTAHPAGPDEKKVIESMVEDLMKKYAADVSLAKEVCGDATVKSDQASIELAVWTIVGNLLYNLDTTKTRE